MGVMGIYLFKIFYVLSKYSVYPTRRIPQPRIQSLRTQTPITHTLYSKHSHRRNVQLISPDHFETGSEIWLCGVARPCARRCRSILHTSKYSKFELGWHCELDNVETGVCTYVYTKQVFNNGSLPIKWAETGFNFGVC